MVPKCFVALTIVLFLVWCSREHPIHRVLRIWLRHLQSHENRSPTQHPLKAIGVGCHGRRGQEKTYRNSVDNKQFWTESKAVVGFKHTIDRHSFLSPTSQTKKNTDCQFQSLYLKTCLCWTCRNCHEGLLCDLGMFLSVFPWSSVKKSSVGHVAKRCKAKDRRRHVDFTSNVTNLVMTSVEGLQKLGILPLRCGV